MLLAHVTSALGLFSVWTWLLLAAALVLSSLILYNALSSTPDENAPPFIPSPIPFLGHALSFGRDPINFLLWAQKKYGDVFSFTMVGKTFTYLVGSEASALLFNSKNADLNAEAVYGKLVTPVFGEGVAYDVPHALFLEQKKMLKSGLSQAHFRRYVPLIAEETEQYFQRWGDRGERDIFEALSELIILTASRCLHGPEVRSILDERVAQLYSDLDGGFSHLAWLLPAWLPMPSFRKRDRANREMKRIFSEIIQARRANPQEGEDEEEHDILNILINSKYKDGRPLTDSEVSGMLIGLLMAGQHTSSTTSAWLGYFVARDPQLQERLLREQADAGGGAGGGAVDYEQLRDMDLLERCLKESLRVQPPIMTLMRLAQTPQRIRGLTIPTGHQVCVSPTANHHLPGAWRDPASFQPDRFLQEDVSSNDKFNYVPFGAGRHRCIGESFAYVQIKTIWSVLIRKYKFELVDGKFPEVNYSTMIHTPTKTLLRYQRR